MTTTAPTLTAYTVTGIINVDSGQLIIAGTYEGHHESVCDDTAVMPTGWERWADTYEAESWQDAEQQARANHRGVVWSNVSSVRDGDRVLVDGEPPARTVAGEPTVVHHAGRSEVVITFRDGGSWTVAADHQVKLV